MAIIETKNATTTPVTSLRTVSYTHLDVYKRQPVTAAFQQNPNWKNSETALLFVCQMPPAVSTK